MPRIIVFDVNETLLNVRILEPQFEQVFGDKSALKEWFGLLLLHSEVAAIAGPYFNFGTIAPAALRMTAAKASAAFYPTRMNATAGTALCCKVSGMSEGGGMSA